MNKHADKKNRLSRSNNVFGQLILVLLLSVIAVPWAYAQTTCAWQGPYDNASYTIGIVSYYDQSGVTAPGAYAELAWSPDENTYFCFSA